LWAWQELNAGVKREYAAVHDRHGFWNRIRPNPLVSKRTPVHFLVSAQVSALPYDAVFNRGLNVKNLNAFLL
jgi:hypothetical protein